MIYEAAVMAKSEISDDQIAQITATVGQVASENGGELLVSDDWGHRVLAQPTSDKSSHGRYLYYVFKAGTDAIQELNRRLRNNEIVDRQMIIKLSDEESEAQQIVKKIKTPYSKKYHGSQVDETDAESGSVDKDRKRFVRKKACWFTAKNIRADWKDPKTYNWLINEFGKISPARVTGISRKSQKIAIKAIKQARNIGIASHISNVYAD